MGVSGQRHAPAALYPGNGFTVPIGQEAGSASAGLDTEARGKILCLYRESNPGRPVCSMDLPFHSSDTAETRMEGVLFREH
jgi:hypothetical protein